MIFCLQTYMNQIFKMRYYRSFNKHDRCLSSNSGCPAKRQVPHGIRANGTPAFYLIRAYFSCLYKALWSIYNRNSDLLDRSKKWENFVNGNKIIFGCLYIALWSSYNMNSDLLNGSKNWENFVNGNKIIFGCLYTGLWSS